MDAIAAAPVETWKPVVGFEGSYEVSDAGRVHSLLTGRVLRPGRRGRYFGYTLCLDGQRHAVYAHHVVAGAFIGPRPDLLDVCHENADRADNRAANLRYDTRAGNMRDSIRHGTHQSITVTNCSKGHEFTYENTYRREYLGADGGLKYKRTCRACMKVKSRRDYEAWKIRHGKVA